ncbi:MAG: hypothetical protein ORN57_01180, partial [Alphaproteobacteria bacterium]|nr:hypothetical protein [Alphaproteobacteria bacterium]
MMLHSSFIMFDWLPGYCFYCKNLFVLPLLPPHLSLLVTLTARPLWLSSLIALIITPTYNPLSMNRIHPSTPLNP